jgi:hypothetical protein
MKFTIYDGPNRVKKRWAIGVFAIAGIVNTIDHAPEWLKAALNFIAGAI